MSFIITKYNHIITIKLNCIIWIQILFLLSIKTTNLLKDLEHFRDDFDFSELDKNHQLYVIINTKVLGKIKMETSPIIELDNFVDLRSKSFAYSFTYKNSVQKGIQKSPQKGKLY